MKSKAIPSQFLIFLTLIFLVFRLFVPLRFQTNDDIVMMMLASGAYSGDPSGNLVFINYFLGSAISGLYRVFPDVDWYPGIMLLALSACCALGLISALHKALKGETFILFAWIALGGLLLSIMVQMQFTTAAAMAAVVGAWSVLTLPGRFMQGVGAALVLFGFLLRFEAAALVLVVGAPFFVLGLWRGVAPLSRNVLLGLVVLLGLGLHVAGERAYQALDPAYVTFNEIRGQLNDNPYGEDLDPEALPEGVSANDYALLLEFFADPRKIGLDDLEALHAAVSEKEQRLTLSDFAAAAQGLLSRDEVLLVLGALVLAAAALPSCAQRLLLLAGCLTFLLPLLYVSVFALLKERVLVGAVASVLGGLFYLNLRGISRWLNVLVQVPLLVLSALFLISAKNQLGHTLSIEPAFRRQADMIMAWEGPVFAYKNHLRTEHARLFTDDLSAFSQKIVFAGWLVKHPENRSYQGHMDLLQDGVALFIRPDRDPDIVQAMLLEALGKNYGIRATADTVAETDQGLLVVFRAVPEQ